MFQTVEKISEKNIVMRYVMRREGFKNYVNIYFLTEGPLTPTPTSKLSSVIR